MSLPKPTILIVDDEPDILSSLEIALELDYHILTATSGTEGLDLLEQHRVALIISDQRMPGMTGVEFLERARTLSPKSLRMMLTGFADFDAIVEAVNKGHIYRYISKPWEPRDLELDVRRAVEAYQMQTALDQRLDELHTLCEIAATIVSVTDSEQATQKILDAVVNTLGFDQALLMVVDEAAQKLRTRGCAGLREEARAYAKNLEYSLDQDDVAVVLTVRENRSILVEDVDDTLESVDRQAAARIGIRSFVTAPLRAGGRSVGVLVADRSGAGDRVSEHDRRLLAGFADQAAIAIENARLYEEAIEKERLREELAVAGRIQRHLLPRRMPDLPGFEIAAITRPSREVSGDYYDVIEAEDGRTWLALGDVCGKGIQAGLTMATLRTLFRTELDRNLPLPETMARIAEGLWLCTAPEVFATFCFGVLDPAERTFTYVNAGHPFPILARENGTIVKLDGAGLPVGMDPTLNACMPYPEQRLDLAPGDVLVIYSDGISEAGVTVESMFGEDRLEAVITAHRNRGACGVQEAVCKALDTHLHAAPPDDDLTLLALSVHPPGHKPGFLEKSAEETA